MAGLPQQLGEAGVAAAEGEMCLSRGRPGDALRRGASNFLGLRTSSFGGFGQTHGLAALGLVNWHIHGKHSLAVGGSSSFFFLFCPPMRLLYTHGMHYIPPAAGKLEINNIQHDFISKSSKNDVAAFMYSWVFNQHLTVIKS